MATGRDERTAVAVHGTATVVRWQLSDPERAEARELPASAVLSVLDDLRARVDKIEFIGEAGARADFFDVLEYAVGAGIPTCFTTGGSAIDARKARWLAAVKGVTLTLRFPLGDRGQDEVALRALGVLADAGVTGLTICLPPEERASAELLALVDRCHGRLRTRPTLRSPRHVWADPAGAETRWFIDPGGWLYRHDTHRDDVSVRIGNVSEPGGFALAWDRAQSGEHLPVDRDQ